MTAFNLVSTAWIPVIRVVRGRASRIRPAHLTEGIAVDPIIDIDFARADFRCATIEFIIGLLTVALPAARQLGSRLEEHRPHELNSSELLLALETVFAFRG